MALKKIDTTSLVIGAEYDRNYLAELWHYNGIQGLAKGIISAAEHKVVLFVTAKKTEDAIQYADKLEGDTLIIDGQRHHATDKAVAEAEHIYLFYREAAKLKNSPIPFTYMGEVVCTHTEAGIGQPHRFIFRVLSKSRANENASEVFPVGCNEDGATYQVEGDRRLVEHLRIERSQANRRQALLYHPHVCSICGFDFDQVYGADLAEGYIDIHHIKPLAEIGACAVNPKTDLIPVCPNCHRMLHHRFKNSVTIEELRQKVRAYRGNRQQFIRTKE